MPRRLWLPATGAPPVAPPFDAAWDVAGEADRIEMAVAAGGPAATKAVSEAVTAVANVLLRQYVSPPLHGPHSLSGTFRGIVQVMESMAKADFSSQAVVRVVSEDGQTERGKLLPATSGGLASEWETSLTTRKFPEGYPAGGAPMNTVEAQHGDRIVVEIGFRTHNTAGAERTGTAQFGSTLPVDLPENEITMTDGAPWVEFSTDLVFTADEVIRYTEAAGAALDLTYTGGRLVGVTLSNGGQHVATAKVRHGAAEQALVANPGETVTLKTNAVYGWTMNKSGIGIEMSVT